MRGRQAIRNEDHLPVGCILRGKKLPGKLQAVLDVREVGGNAELADILAAHVRLQPHPRIENCHRLGHQAHDLAGAARLGEGIHLDKLQKISRIFAADQPLQCQAHPFHVHVQSAVPHRTAHIHEHRGGAFRRVASPVYLNVFAPQPQRESRSLAYHRIRQRGGNIHIRHRVAELIVLGALHLHGPLADNRTLVAACARSLQLAENLLQQLALE
jgi:hypothetical protein